MDSKENKQSPWVLVKAGVSRKSTVNSDVPVVKTQITKTKTKLLASRQRPRLKFKTKTIGY